MTAEAQGAGPAPLGAGPTAPVRARARQLCAGDIIITETICGVSVSKRISGSAFVGVTVEDNDHTWRIDHLREIPAVVRFVSYEPACGPVDM